MHKEIGGFFSVPISIPTEDFQESKERERIAILNVHWKRAKRFHITESAENFAQIIYPFRVLLAQQLMKDRTIADQPDSDS